MPTPTPQTPTGKPGRKHCDNCFRLFLKNPRRPDKRFCSDRCRMDFHHHGGAIGKLQPVLERRIDRTMLSIRAELAALKAQLNQVQERIAS